VFAAPISIPSPSSDWQQLHIPYGEWLHAIFPGVDPSLSLRVTTYAIVIIIGIFAAVIITNRRLTRRGGEPWVIVDVGGRARHHLRSPVSRDHPPG
jgi:ABC-type nitrate/sulfonate/bicarbonate transport system permease component